MAARWVPYFAYFKPCGLHVKKTVLLVLFCQTKKSGVRSSPSFAEGGTFVVGKWVCTKDELSVVQDVFGQIQQNLSPAPMTRF